MDTLIRFGLRLKLILSKATHAKTTAVLDWNKHFLAFAVEGTRVMNPTPKMGFTQNPRTIKSVFGANAHAFKQGCEKVAMTLIARSQFIIRLVATLLLVVGLTSMPAQAAQGSTVFIPIAVGDITTFIPIMPTASTAQISTTGGSHNLSWSAVSNASYYQIIITDEHGLQRIFQTTDTDYVLAGLPLGNNKVEVQACNAYNQCGIRYLAGTVTITTRVIYQHTDILGSVVAESDEAGNIISRSHYEPFGKRLGGDKAGIGYTGHLQDKDLGLTYMQARYYDPLIGRFYSNDPISYRGVHSFNRYAYANNNPYKYIDPTGNNEEYVAGISVGIGFNAEDVNLIATFENSVYNYNFLEGVSLGQRIVEEQMFQQLQLGELSSLSMLLGIARSNGKFGVVKGGYHATHPEAAEAILQGGFRKGTKPGRLGSGGTYVNNTPEGAIAEFAHHNPGVTPKVLKVNYNPGTNANAVVAPQNYVDQLPLNVNSISAPSVRAPGTINTNVLNGSARATEILP
ncbi:RHS repeat-associated core domain-containing protein [Shewanella denitrificans]|uniref:RHS repeat-associated core domain-containing protein n=1 Tax=Shewanella denitrificans TaxID=192073 RepID=UPI00030891AB|nr:RHS repeat-associated core domain-containing protein [Shewanella denitrificans]